MSLRDQFPHYFKDVSTLQSLDVYRVLTLFGVTDPCIQHAIKKLLVAGGRGAGKDIQRDVQEAQASLTRFLEMRQEDLEVPVEFARPWRAALAECAGCTAPCTRADACPMAPAGGPVATPATPSRG